MATLNRFKPKALHSITSGAGNKNINLKFNFMNTQNDFFQNSHDRIFSVVLLWNIGQPFVCGTLEKVVEYALKPNNAISHFVELTNGYKKVSKKDLKSMLERQHKEMSIELFSKY